MDKEKKHVHAYAFWKQTKSGNKYYYCVDPSCTHTSDARLLRGKTFLCPKCFEKPVIMTPAALQRKRPLCLDCGDYKDARAHKLAKQVYQQILQGPLGLIEQGND